jgi:lysophospholipase L1-like esterase
MHIVMSTDSLSLPRPWFQAKPALEPDKFTRLAETYPLLVEAALRRRLSFDARVTNMATRASGIAATFAQRLDLFSWMEPTVSLIHKGVVDCWPREAKGGEPNTTPDAFRESLQKLMDERFRMNPDNRLILVGIAPTNAHALSKTPALNQTIAIYNEILKSFRDENTVYVDMEAVHAVHGEQILHPDGHHLSRIGHRHLAEEILQAVDELVPSLGETA